MWCRTGLAPTLQMSPSCVTKASVPAASRLGCPGQQDGSGSLGAARGVGTGGRCHPRVLVPMGGSPLDRGAQLGGQQVVAAQGAQVGAQASEGLADVLQRGAPGLAWGQGDGDSGRGARPGGFRRAPRQDSPAPAPRSPPALSQMSSSAWKALVASGRRLISCQSEEGVSRGGPTRGRGPPPPTTEAHLEQPAQDGRRAGGAGAVQQAEEPGAHKRRLAGGRGAGRDKKRGERHPPHVPVSPCPPPRQPLTTGTAPPGRCGAADRGRRAWAAVTAVGGRRRSAPRGAWWG